MKTARSTQLPLEGLTILVTRPQRQAEQLALAIAAAGGEALVFPTIEIQAVADDSSVRAIVERLNDYQIAIFVSANAVEQGMRYLSHSRKDPSALVFAAIGEATKNALQSYGIANVLAPAERFDSEALLDLPEMRDVAGKRILIFRGEGGRGTLAEVLKSRGAAVEHAICYRRTRPERDINVLRTRWHAGDIHAVSAMSTESLTNLYDILDGSTRALLMETPIFVPHSRIKEASRALGLVDVRVTGASNEGLIKELSLICERG